MLPDDLGLLANHDITLLPRANFWSGPVFLEPPIEIRQGTYQAGRIGAFTYLGGRSTLMLHIESIGRFCSIAGNIITGQTEHPTNFLSASPIFQGSFKWKQADEFRAGNRENILKSRNENSRIMSDRFGKITIGNDVWIGEGAFIRRGVTIGDGAVIGAHAVVSKDVEPYSIVAGMPAKLIRYRFDKPIIDELLRIRWWDYGLSALHGVDFTDIESAISKIKQNIEDGTAAPYKPDVISIDNAGLTTVSIQE